MRSNDVELKGAHRVAALLLVAGKPVADRIVRQLDDREIRALARAVMELPAVGYDKVSRLIDDLASELDIRPELVGSSEEAENLLTGVVDDEEINEIIAELVGQPPKRIWSRLVSIPDEKIAGFLTSEQPQVAVFVLSSLPVEKASSLLERLEPALRADLSRRLLSTKPISDAAARLVADRIAQEMFGDAEAASRPNNHARLGAILNQIERQHTDEILERLEASSPADAAEVRRYLFAFEDLTKLSPGDRGRLCNDVSAEQLVLALRGAALELRSAVLAAVSPRTGRLIEAELSTEVKVQPTLVLEARRSIAKLALSLADKGEINLGNMHGGAETPAGPA